MKQYFIFILFLALFSASFYPSFSQKNNPLFTIGGEKCFADEFNYAFYKNNFKGAVTRDSIDNYLKLYINFRLKVKAAKTNGYDTTLVFKQEFAQYKNQLENSYLSPKKEQEALIKEAYDRSLWEIKASHILLMVKEDASPKDTLLLFNKINAIRERVVNGENFNQLATQLSEDPSAKQNGGLLGYFSVMQMVYPFETAAYTTAVGQVSKPVRTQFGYHIIKVEDKRPNEGKVQVAHIMINATPKNNEEFNKAAKAKIYFIDSLLKAGNDWNNMCNKYSEDLNSASKNGELRIFGRGQIVPEFEEVAFDLQHPNQISDPVQTPFGWHIIKLLKRVPVGTFEEEKSNLANKIKSDARSSMPRNEMLKTLKKENQFVRNEQIATQLKEHPPSMVVNNKWNFDSLTLSDKKILFSIGKLTVTTAAFLNSINSTSFKSVGNIKHEMEVKLNNYEDSLVISYEKAHLSDKNPDYKYLLNEYYDGILLFSIMEDSVWNKSMTDSTGLKSFYVNTKDNYVHLITDTTVFISNSKPTLDELIIKTKQTSTLKEWDKLKSQLLKEYNVSPLTLQVVSSSNPKLDTIRNLIKMNGMQPFEAHNKWFWIRVAQVKTHYLLEEVKGRVISEYQDYLDTQWIEQLRLKYPVNINKKELKKVYAKFEATN